MKKVSIFIILLTIVLAQACYKDKGNYNYTFDSQS